MEAHSSRRVSTKFPSKKLQCFTECRQERKFNAPKIAKNFMPDDNDEKTCFPVQVMAVMVKFLIRQFYQDLKRCI